MICSPRTSKDIILLIFLLVNLSYPVFSQDDDGTVFGGILPQEGHANGLYTFPRPLTNLDFGYFAKDFLPQCGFSWSWYPRPVLDDYRSGPDCAQAMKIFMSAAFANTPVQLFDLEGIALDNYAIKYNVVGGIPGIPIPTCLCFAVGEWWEDEIEGKEVHGANRDICLFLTEEVAIQYRSSGPVMLYQKDPIRSNDQVLPLCGTRFRQLKDPWEISGWMTTLNPNHTMPRCASDEMKESCPELHDALSNCYIKGMYDFNEGNSCLISVFANTSCTSVCSNVQKDRKAYRPWISYVDSILQDAGQLGENQAGDWTDRQFFKGVAYSAYLSVMPWGWYVTYNIANDPQSKTLNESLTANEISEEEHRSKLEALKMVCPTRTQKLGVFALVNVITLISTLLLGRRDVVYFITRGKFGRPEGNEFWPIYALSFALLGVISNVINAGIVHNTPGYSGVPIGDLALLFCSRPRLAWIGVLFIGIGRQKTIYFGIATTAMIGEVVLQLLGSVYLGRTASRGASRGYFLAKAMNDTDGGKYALMMYVGALLWVVSIIPMFLSATWSFWGVRAPMTGRALKGVAMKILPCLAEQASPDTHDPRRLDEPDLAEAEKPSLSIEEMYAKALKTMGFEDETDRKIQVTIVFLALPFLGQWLFWVGFVDFAGDL